jgi:NADPH:quinone reductase-like Zn-dependent oxidoreductase
MRAIVHDVYGDADVLTLRDIAQPTPRPDQVLIQVYAAGLDRGAWHLMTGLPYAGRLAFGLRAPKARTRGLDVAGRVVAVGAEVTAFQPGDDVYGTCDGSFADYAVTSPNRLARKPANLTYEQAAAVGVSAVTALQAVRDKGRVRSGQSVLVIGASGGVGSYATQLAVAFGAEVTGVCGASKADLVRGLGASRVIDYASEELTGRYDVVIDTGGNRPLGALRPLLTPRGTLVIVGGEGGGRVLGGAERSLRAAALAPFVRQKLVGLLALVRTADLDTLRDLIEAGKVTPAVDRVFPLAETPAAMRYLVAGKARGKVVISVV